MKRAKGEDGSNSMDRISVLPLPREILQRILYSLSQEEAVRTSVLSKSWRYIWCTRSNLDFSDTPFRGDKRKFISVVNTSLQRYHDRKLRFEEFRLSLSLGVCMYGKLVKLLERWIPRLPNMGVKDSRLSIRREYQECVTDSRLSIGGEDLACVELPPVVFGAESLQDLHVQGFQLDQKAIERMVLFKHLKSLRLVRVSIEEEIFEKIISCCPSIETLDVKECKELNTVSVNDLQNLKYVYFSGKCKFTVYPPSLVTVKLISGELSFHEGADFCNLTRLSLLAAKLSSEHLSSCNFPSLQFLEISLCKGLEESELFIDAPNIKRFEYRGTFAPSISFATTSKKWKSFIRLTYERGNVAPSTWFLKLKELLKSLSQSKVSLTLDQSYMYDVIQEKVQDSGCDKPVVESLILLLHLSSISSFLYGALRVCRPENIEEFLYERKRIELMWKILMQTESTGEEDQFRDLEEVRMEICNNNREEWRSITLSELPKSKEMAYHRIRFALKWRD